MTSSEVFQVIGQPSNTHRFYSQPNPRPCDGFCKTYSL
jgi:hypothetical protein